MPNEKVSRGKLLVSQWKKNKVAGGYVGLAEYAGYQYERYLRLCVTCGETQKTKSEWLREMIVPATGTQVFPEARLVSIWNAGV